MNSRATKGCMLSTDKGNNGTVSEAVSSVKPPRRMKRKANVMWSTNSSSCDDDDVNANSKRNKAVTDSSGIHGRMQILQYQRSHSIGTSRGP